MVTGSRPARLNVGVVSAGRVGAVLGAALAGAGHHVVAASGVSSASVDRARRLLDGVPLKPPPDVVEAADLVVLAMPDDVLEPMVRGLAGSFREGQIVVHTSGAHSTGVLAPAAARGALCVALHPAMTFTGRSEDVERLRDACVGVTAADGDVAAEAVGETLALELGAEPVRVPAAARPLYHAALTHGANHLVTLVDDAVDLLKGAGIEPAERVLAPLLEAALDNALRHGDKALTGPVARGDAGTVRKHLGVLVDEASDVVAPYAAMARRTAIRAERSGMLKDADAVHAVLGGSE